MLDKMRRAHRARTLMGLIPEIVSCQGALDALDVLHRHGTHTVVLGAADPRILPEISEGLEGALNDLLQETGGLSGPGQWHGLRMQAKDRVLVAAGKARVASQGLRGKLGLYRGNLLRRHRLEAILAIREVNRRLGQPPFNISPLPPLPAADPHSWSPA